MPELVGRKDGPAAHLPLLFRRIPFPSVALAALSLINVMCVEFRNLCFHPGVLCQ